MPSKLCFVVVSVSLLVGAGCSSGPRGGQEGGPTRADELHEVGTMLTLLSGSGRGYAKAADLAPYSDGCPLGYKALKSGDVVIVQGATMPGEGDKKGTDAIVAYEKAAPDKGGHVLLHNGTVKKMTADEFARAEKFKR